MNIYILNAFLALFLLLGYGAICVGLGFIAQLYHTRYVANKRKGDHNNGKA